jgi:PKD repeat protein
MHKSATRFDSIAYICLVSIFSLFSLANATIPNRAEMSLVARNWVAYMAFHKGEWAGAKSPAISASQDIIANDTLLGRCFNIEPAGYVIVPNLKEMAPIKAYSDDSEFDPNAPEGFSAMIREVLQDRVRIFVETYGSMEADQSGKSEPLFGSEQGQAWDRFLVSPETFDADLKAGKADKMEEYGPLLTTSWHQGEPYYNLCPWGDGGRTVVGCVATAMAQIMAYHKWPINGTGRSIYHWDGDNSCGGSTPGEFLECFHSDIYDWDNIPNAVGAFSPQEQIDAVAELCYEAGVSVGMMYGACGSGAYMSSVENAFPEKFRYVDSIQIVERADYTFAQWSGFIREEMMANRPIDYAIHRHSIVADGWRLAIPMAQVHMNYGWGGSQTAWYTIDDLYCPWQGCSYLVELMLINIKPDNDVYFTSDTCLGVDQLDVKFEGYCADSVDQWIWDFGDGDSAFIQSPEHVYNKGGRYDVRLTAVCGGQAREYEAAEFITVLDDSLQASDIEGPPGESLEMIICAKNTVPIRKIQIPIKYSGPLNLTLDSFSVDGCRAYFFSSVKFTHYDAENYRATVTLNNAVFNQELGTFDLDPGYGPILKLYFTIPGSSTSSDPNPVIIEGYMTYSPMFYGPIADNAPHLDPGTISIDFICGDANGDGRVNALDITFMINYLYKKGAAPEPNQAADVNHDGRINALDVTYMINCMYKGGDPPDCR